MEAEGVVSGAEERRTHPEGVEFNRFFSRLLFETKSCWARDVLRSAKEDLWREWKRRCDPDWEPT
jgi:hypothetical protein